MNDGEVTAGGMAVRYRLKDGTWVTPAARREASGWWWPVPEDCGEIAEVVILGGGGAEESGATAHSGYGGGE